MISRRRFIHGMAAGAAAIFFGQRTEATIGPRKIKIGVLAPSHCALPVVYAGAGGLFHRFGLEVDIQYAGSMKEIIKGVHSGALHFGQLTTPIVLAVSGNSPSFPHFPLSVTQVLGINGGALSVATREEISKLTDLKGKAIGIHSPYIIHYLILTLILRKAGLEPGRDLRIKTIPMPETAQALKEGRIDAFIDPEPFPTFIESTGLTRTLLTTRMFWRDHPCCVLASKRGLADDQPELVHDVAMSCMLAGLMLDSVVLRDQAIRTVHMQSPTYAKLPLTSLIRAFQPRRSDFYPFPFQSSFLLAGRQMKKLGLLPAEALVEQQVSRVVRSGYALDVMGKVIQEVPGARMPDGMTRQEEIKIIG